MSVFSSSDKVIARHAKAAEYRAASAGTPLSWLPGFLKKGFQDSAGNKIDGQIVNYNRGIETGLMMGFAYSLMFSGRITAAFTLASLAIGLDLYDQYRGKRIVEAAKNELNPR